VDRPRLLTRTFAFCSAANFAQALSFNLFLHFPGYLAQLGADEVRIGFIFGLTAFAAIAARPPVGRAMDRRGRRSVILLGGVLNSLACALYLGVTSIGPAVYAIRIVHGLAEALLFTSLFTFAADLVPVARRTEGLAWFGASGMITVSLAGLLGDALLARFDFSVLFAVSLGLALLSLLVSLPLRDPVLPASAAREPSRGFLAALVQRDLLPLWWVGTAFSIGIASIFTFVKTFVMQTGVGSAGVFFTAYAGAALLVRLSAGWLPDRVGPERVLYPSLVTLCLGLALLARASATPYILAAGLCAGAGHGFVFPILFGMVVTRAREADRGSALAIFTALFDTGVLLGGPSFGAVIRAAGYPVMFASAALWIAFGTIVFFLWERRR
jgi:MFS family permease